MKKYKLQRVVPFVLISSMLLTGCGKKMECNLPARHVHQYKKNITNSITLTNYYDSEYEQVNGYNWQEDYIEITKTDEELYKVLNNRDLFDAKTNWDYLYYEMSCLHDWLEFYYEYDTTETTSYTDSDGNVHTETHTVHHSGWHTNPRDGDNTGDVRLNHHRYYAYRVVYKDGKFQLERSRLVDDVRDVLEDYPYACEKGYDVVHRDFKFKRSDLPKLKASDFDTFRQPDLTNKTPNLGTGLSK